MWGWDRPGLFEQWLSTAPTRGLFLPFRNHHLCQSGQHEAAADCSKGTAGC